MFRNTKRFTAILLVLILAASTYAFAAANTVGGSNVGYGTKTMTGYAVNNIAYISSSSDNNVTSITMELSDSVLRATVSEKPTTIRLSTNVTVTAAEFAKAACTAAAGTPGTTGTFAAPWMVTCVLTPAVPYEAITHINLIASSSTNFIGVP